MAKDLTEALRALTESGAGQTSRVDKALPDRPNPPAIPSRTGTAGRIPGAAGTGIASPLTETAFTDRQYWAGGIQSTDGLFQLPAIKSISLKDANDAPVVVNFAEPE